jgi:hypothetical protein
VPSEEGQLTETCKGSKYIQIELHWTVLTIIIPYNLDHVYLTYLMLQHSLVTCNGHKLDGRKV